MPWPRATDYNAAIQHPRRCFSDPQLSQGQAAADPFGLPLPYSGNFADVYQVRCPDGSAWAVKCFTLRVPDLRQRYQAVSEHLARQRRSFTVEFRYLEEGIRVQGEWYPVLKMRWVEGFNLNEFIGDHLDNPALIQRLAGLWLKLAGQLVEAGIGHGDLQHGNVLLVPGDKQNAMSLRLIDYDGMWVPALAGNPPGEVGHPNYQHPERLRRGGYGAEVDRFAHLVVYAALRAVAAGGAGLWKKYDNAENLLFRKADFDDPAEARLFGDLAESPDEEVRALAGHLLLASRGPLAEVPLLAELLDGNRVRRPGGAGRARVPELVARPAPEAASAPAPDWLTAAPPLPTSLPPPIPVRGRSRLGTNRAPVLPELPSPLQSGEAPAAIPLSPPAQRDGAVRDEVPRAVLLPPLPPRALPRLEAIPVEGPPRPAPAILDALPADAPRRRRRDGPPLQVVPVEIPPNSGPAVPPLTAVPVPVRPAGPGEVPPRLARNRDTRVERKTAVGPSAGELLLRWWPALVGAVVAVLLLALLTWLLWQARPQPAGGRGGPRSLPSPLSPGPSPVTS